MKPKSAAQGRYFQFLASQRRKNAEPTNFDPAPSAHKEIKPELVKPTSEVDPIEGMAKEIKLPKLHKMMKIRKRF